MLILENIGLAELQGGGMGKRKRKEKEQTHHFLSSRFLCIFVKEKPYQQMYLRFVIKQDWKEWGFWSIKQTAQPSWWGGGPLIIQACIFPTCGWRLQAALKEQGRMQNDPRHHWFFCLAQKMPHLSVFLFLPSFIYYWMNIITVSKGMTIEMNHPQSNHFETPAVFIPCLFLFLI